MAQNLTLLLSNLTVKDYLSKEKKAGRRHLVTLQTTNTIEEALKMLSENHILSAPVQDPASGKWIGFVDMQDLLSATLAFYAEGRLPVVDSDWLTWCEDIDTLDKRGVRFGIKPLTHIVDLSGYNPFCPVHDKTTVFEVVEQIFREGVHRAPVMSEAGQLVDIISQSDVVYFIARNMNLLGGYSKKTVDELGLVAGDVISVNINVQAIHAFWVMAHYKVSGVAICGDGGQLLGSLSTSDLRSLRHQSFSSLLQPLLLFLTKRIPLEEEDEKNAPVFLTARKAPITVKRTSSLGDVLHKIILNRIHRVWIVDDEEKPIGVVSLSDIMRIVANAPAPVEAPAEEGPDS